MAAPYRLEPRPGRISPRLILRLQRYRDLSQVPPPIVEVAEAMARLAERLVEPRALVLPVPIAAVEAEEVRLADGPTFHSRALASMLRSSEQAVLFLLTLGPRLEAEVSARSEAKELLEAVLLDTAGWVAIEGGVRALRAHLRECWRAAGRGVTHRLAPGYLDWPLAEQALLFRRFGGANDLVRLTGSGVMVPLKSISGLYGVFPLGDCPRPGR
ncbi:MAG: hypothetical protein HYV61_03900 [Candidatus Rokubacteria bacterium]|nr:hypothetical protein [Candidatus Rokubacteria bacterium]